MYPRNIIHRIGVSLPLERLVADTADILSRHPLTPTSNQLCLTHEKDSDDPLDGGVGRNEGTEERFSQFNREFANTVFETFYNEVPFRLGRVRLMGLEPRRCYSIHVDREPRLHVALVTTPNAFIAVQDGEHRLWNIHVPQNGDVYWIDTRRPHTAINTDGEVYRIHLVATILGPRQ